MAWFDSWVWPHLRRLARSVQEDPIPQRLAQVDLVVDRLQCSSDDAAWRGRFARNEGVALT